MHVRQKTLDTYFPLIVPKLWMGTLAAPLKADSFFNPTVHDFDKLQQEVTVSFLTTKLKGEDQNTLKGGALLQLLLIIGLTITTTTTVLYSYNDQMDCCWTCSGHLQENHEIELNTNLSVDRLCTCTTQYHRTIY